MLDPGGGCGRSCKHPAGVRVMLRFRLAQVVLVAVVAVVGAVVPAPSRAQQQQKLGADEREAKGLFQLGSQAYAEARYDRALVHFQEAYRLAPHPTVQVNIGTALALAASARAAVSEACREVDRRVAAERVPDTADYFRQQAIITMAVEQLSAAMDLLVRVQGGNGLREGGTFERRVRDFRAMPLHVNVHRDRVVHQVGRLALGVDLDPF